MKKLALVALISTGLLLSACGVDCTTLDDCQTCVDNSCVWVEWQDGATECGADKNDFPPADSAITESAESCS